MKTIRVTRRSKTINTLLDHARSGHLIIQTADGTEFMVRKIDDFDKEIAATRGNQKLMDLLDARVRQTEWIPLEEVEKRLGLADVVPRGAKSKRDSGRKK